MTTTSNDSLFRSSFYHITANKLVLLGVLLLGIIGAAMAEQKRVGGMTGVTSLENGLVSAEDKNLIQGLLDKVRPDAELKAGRKFDELTPVAYATQLVNGVNYFIKANTGGTGDKRYVVIRLHKSFRDDVTFHSIQVDKTEADPITYF
ncbi:cystatin-A2-like [Lytechinus variegatus]|uniref:cystatin-A2-like n=1 Tax=Lytechinus variegatus TaxID=7654 RepID=UPI001BB2A327|nr:cystatin-A2-like [Lytechinus variegatus]XP_041463134.1 cystatin-A2-like [Lytechinus variegatus]